MDTATSLFMIIKNNYGRVHFGLKHDLNAEESSDRYISDFYSGSVVELSMIESATPGGGSHLMRQFLKSELAQSAKLIFLDCCPLFMDKDEQIALQFLHDFYKKFGFVSTSNDGNRRMWLIKSLPLTLDQCFGGEIDESNDLHILLRNAFEKRDSLYQDYNNVANSY